MTSEVREAAGRLRQIKTTSEAVVYLDHPLFLAGFSFAKAIAYDKDILANAYLAEHADDDELPIDEAWLNATVIDWIGITMNRPQYRAGADYWHAFISGSNGQYHGRISTRGEFRALCRFANIPLQPIGQEQGK